MFRLCLWCHRSSGSCHGHCGRATAVQGYLISHVSLPWSTVKRTQASYTLPRIRFYIWHRAILCALFHRKDDSDGLMSLTRQLRHSYVYILYIYIMYSWYIHEETKWPILCRRYFKTSVYVLLLLLLLFSKTYLNLFLRFQWIIGQHCIWQCPSIEEALTTHHLNQGWLSVQGHVYHRTAMR